MLEIFINENNLLKAKEEICSGNYENGAKLIKLSMLPLIEHEKVKDEFWQQQVYNCVCGLMLLKLENPKNKNINFEDLFISLKTELENICNLISVQFLDNSKKFIGYEIGEETIRLLSTLLTSTKIKMGIMTMAKMQLERIVLINDNDIK